MEKIADPAEVSAVRAELNEGTFLRYTNKGQNEVHLITAKDAPNVMHEIGRLREEAFRASGGGTGLALDIDHYDTSEFPYSQVIVWNEEDSEVMAGYRVLDCREINKQAKGMDLLATNHLFNFSDNFVKNYLPQTLELGRSFVQPKYQKGQESKKGLFALDNLWDGLGAVIYRNESIKYLLGKVTMYPTYDRDARNALLAFLAVYFPDRDNLAMPINPLVGESDLAPWKKQFDGKNYKEAYLLLNTFIRSKGLNIPPLINSYMNLSDTMHTFGTSINDEFGDVEETGILIMTQDIYAPKYERHILSYPQHSEYGKPHWME
ncbi:GNAT family N-acetyltransferase [Phaeocystidibacter luteus]|uniref:GNAT family N-acetyltransferase n=1 Tax=Phaeocystidibacter luteus TaxID=911197 RepID=A0A6N6RLS3_9FLAO|nr:GNAT family N-acetyltransferase [Phaeocystidibacter luteus]KAB2814517.1 GNAT family N-acetyltransferase [Phaeocystidibacter luteus]